MRTLPPPPRRTWQKMQRRPRSRRARCAYRFDTSGDRELGIEEFKASFRPLIEFQISELRIRTKEVKHAKERIQLEKDKSMRAVDRVSKGDRISNLIDDSIDAVGQRLTTSSDKVMKVGKTAVGGVIQVGKTGVGGVIQAGNSIRRKSISNDESDSVFAAMDKNRDGVITSSELAAVDTNADGVISIDELRAAAVSKPEEGAQEEEPSLLPQLRTPSRLPPLNQPGLTTEGGKDPSSAQLPEEARQPDGIQRIGV